MEMSPRMWNGKTLAVILPTYNEKDSIAEVICRFEALGFVDDILVVNNNAAEGTSVNVAATSAREVRETTQGYGAAIRRGLREVDADLVCICEPDGTFNPEDLRKLLPYTDECEFVIGSRTVSNFIWDGANMGFALQWGNWLVAKSPRCCTTAVISAMSAAPFGFFLVAASSPSRRSSRSTVPASAWK